MMEVFVPRESVNDQSVIVQRVVLADGAVARNGDVVAEIETSKTVIEMTAPADGVVRHGLQVGQEIEVGALLFTVGDPTQAAAVVSSPTPATAPVAAAGTSSTDAAVTAEEPIGASPAALSGEPAVLSRAAQRAAQRLGVDLSLFQGRWVTEDDILAGRPAVPLALTSDPTTVAPPQGMSTAAPVAAASAALPRPALAHDEVAQGMRKRAEVDNLLKGQHAATTSTIGMRIELPGERLVAPDFLFKDSISDLVVFEAARLLRQYPELNGFHIDARSAGQYKAVNFGISFDNHRNLKVLTLAEADQRGLPDIQRRYVELLDLFESNRPLPGEVLGGATVTLSDLSATSASYMLPLINGQQALILGVVRHHRRVFEIFASFDHRVSEGLRVVRFLETLRDRIVSHYRGSDGVARLSCNVCGKTMADEVRLGGRGFVNLTLKSGETGHLCRNCFEGR